MTERREPLYHQKAVDYIKKDNDKDAYLEYLGEFEGYEVYEIHNAINPNEAMVSDFLLVNEEEINKSLYHESVAIAQKFDR